MVAPTRDVKNSGADPPAAIQVALGMAGCCWMLLDAAGCCWMLLDAAGCCWMLLDAAGALFSSFL